MSGPRDTHVERAIAEARTELVERFRRHVDAIDDDEVLWLSWQAVTGEGPLGEVLRGAPEDAVSPAVTSDQGRDH